MENKKNRTLSKCLPTQSSSAKIDNDIMIQKFIQLKEEILACEQDDQLFLLTKEIKFACENYHNTKKVFWKSGTLIKFYLTTLKRLVKSRVECYSNRMDEIDILIMIAEFFICTFQGSEMLTNRNLLLNENSAAFIKDLIEYLLHTPTVKCLSIKTSSKERLESELHELLSTWTDTCVSLLYEVINAANQSNWCCSMEQKSFDATMLIALLCSKEQEVMNVIDHVMTKITMVLSPDWEIVPSPGNVVLLYKYLVTLHFISTNCPKINQYVRTYYQEEIKYYIGKKENVEKLPRHYPLTPIISSYLPIVIRSITQ